MAHLKRVKKKKRRRNSIGDSEARKIRRLRKYFSEYSSVAESTYKSPSMEIPLAERIEDLKGKLDKLNEESSVNNERSTKSLKKEFKKKKFVDEGFFSNDLSSISKELIRRRSILDKSKLLETLLNQYPVEEKVTTTKPQNLFGMVQEIHVIDTTFGPNSFGHPVVGVESDTQVTIERSLDLLTDQYGKTSHTEDRLDLIQGMLLDEAGDKCEHNMMPPAMVQLNNGESVSLARELRDKRDQLEQLVQKNMFTTNVNELSTPKHDMFNTSTTSGHSSTLARSKDTSRSYSVLGGGGAGYTHQHGVQALPGTAHTPDPAPTPYTDVSWVPVQVHFTSVQGNITSQQLYRIQDQGPKLKRELDRLSYPQLLQSQPRPEEASHNEATQLSASIDQLYAGLWAMQRDVSNLTERRQVLESNGDGRPERLETIPSPNIVDDNTEQLPGNNTKNNNIWPWSSAVNGLAEPDAWPGLGSTQQQQHQNSFPQFDQFQYFSQFPSTTTGVDSLIKNIYGQVGALIQQYDRAPELLARFLQDLTVLGQQDMQREDLGISFRSRNTAANMNLATVDTSEETRDAKHDQTRAGAR